MSIKQHNILVDKILNEQIEGLKKKSEKSGISYGILKKVYDRGMAAWKTGHRPGTTAQQWAFARVNSFITKGKGTWGKADKDLASKVRGESFEINEKKSNLGRSLKLINKIKNSGVVKTGSMSKDEKKVDERRMSIDRFFAGKGNRSSYQKFNNRKQKPHKTITHQHDDDDMPHQHTTDHDYKKHSK